MRGLEVQPQAKLAETSGQAGEKEIRQFAARYAETDSAGSAMVYAAMLANTLQAVVSQTLLKRRSTLLARPQVPAAFPTLP